MIQPDCFMQVMLFLPASSRCCSQCLATYQPGTVIHPKIHPVIRVCPGWVEPVYTANPDQKGFLYCRGKPRLSSRQGCLGTKLKINPESSCIGPHERLNSRLKELETVIEICGVLLVVVIC